MFRIDEGLLTTALEQTKLSQETKEALPSGENLFLEGDNLEALKLLQATHLNKVKMIYIDPPYNTGNKSRSYKDSFTHDDWCMMMYPRLYLARSLLRDDGVIFISIDDKEQANLKLLCNEIFGERNFVAQFIWRNKKGGGNDSKYIAVEHEYLVCYAKNESSLKAFFEPYESKYLSRYKENDEKGKFYWDTFKRKSGKQYYAIKCPDNSILEYDERGNPISWLRSEGRFLSDLKDGEIRFVKSSDHWSVQFKQRLPEGKKPRSILVDFGTTSSGNSEIMNLFSKEIFPNSKPIELLKNIMRFSSDKNDIILDFFAGSATTAHAVMKLNAEDGGNRKFIMVQLPEKTKEDSEAYNAGYKTIADIAKERIRRAGKKIGYDSSFKEIML